MDFFYENTTRRVLTEKNNNNIIVEILYNITPDEGLNPWWYDDIRNRGKKFCVTHCTNIKVFNNISFGLKNLYSINDIFIVNKGTQQGCGILKKHCKIIKNVAIQKEITSTIF